MFKEFIALILKDILVCHLIDYFKQNLLRILENFHIIVYFIKNQIFTFISL